MWNRPFIFRRVLIAVWAEKSVTKGCCCLLFSLIRAVLKGFSCLLQRKHDEAFLLVFVQNILGTRLHVFVEALRLRGKN